MELSFPFIFFLVSPINLLDSCLSTSELVFVAVIFIGRGLLGKLGRKTSVLDDNRRATYNISNSPAPRSESIFSTFEDEVRQLVAVGHKETDFCSHLCVALSYPVIYMFFFFPFLFLD